ncbi:MAG: hypothetical protein WCV90_03480 [Candidatus Woesearchaeota archaeon]
MEIGFYSHHGHTTTFDNVSRELTAAGIKATRLECLCHFDERTSLPEIAIVDPSYTEERCWENIREVVERNSHTAVYVTPFTFMDETVISEMKRVLGDQRNVTYVPYADISKMLLGLMPRK